jgi:hypothetical protein
MLDLIFGNDEDSTAYFLQLMEKPSVKTYGAFVNGQIVGTAVCTIKSSVQSPSFAMLHFIAIAASYVGLRRGFGRQFLSSLCADMTTAPAATRPVALFTDADQTAIPFYEKCGWASVASSKGRARRLARLRQQCAATMDKLPKPKDSVEMGIEF